tara:strand:- start:2548 stop:4422 length:1875 start_codon:yes stop_codon:yes gene_type:complete
MHHFPPLSADKAYLDALDSYARSVGSKKLHVSSDTVPPSDEPLGDWVRTPPASARRYECEDAVLVGDHEFQGECRKLLALLPLTQTMPAPRPMRVEDWTLPPPVEDKLHWARRQHLNERHHGFECAAEVRRAVLGLECWLDRKGCEPVRLTHTQLPGYLEQVYPPPAPQIRVALDAAKAHLVQARRYDDYCDVAFSPALRNCVDFDDAVGRIGERAEGGKHSQDAAMLRSYLTARRDALWWYADAMARVRACVADYVAALKPGRRSLDDLQDDILDVLVGHLTADDGAAQLAGAQLWCAYKRVHHERFAKKLLQVMPTLHLRRLPTNVELPSEGSPGRGRYPTYRMVSPWPELRSVLRDAGVQGEVDVIETDYAVHLYVELSLRPQRRPVLLQTVMVREGPRGRYGAQRPRMTIRDGVREEGFAVNPDGTPYGCFPSDDVARNAFPFHGTNAAKEAFVHCEGSKKGPFRESTGSFLKITGDRETMDMSYARHRLAYDTFFTEPITCTVDLVDLDGNVIAHGIKPCGREFKKTGTFRAPHLTEILSLAPHPDSVRKLPALAKFYVQPKSVRKSAAAPDAARIYRLRVTGTAPVSPGFIARFVKYSAEPCVVVSQRSVTKRGRTEE